MLVLKTIATEGKELEIIRSLFVEYLNELEESLSFQNFDEELDFPLKKYGQPFGLLVLAYFNGEPAGCVAFADISNSEKKICEMKRLYVKPAYRKHKIGAALVQEILKSAANFGFEEMKLDSLEKLQSAINLYKKFGFTVAEAYYSNPLPDVVYMEKKLT